MHAVSIAAGIVLAGLLAWGAANSGRQYRMLEEAIAGGDRGARLAFYRDAVVFEWLSALLGLAGLGFRRANLTAAALQFGRTAFGRWAGNAISGASGNFAAGLAAGIAIGIAVQFLAKRRRRTRSGNRPGAPRRKWLPEFAVLIPRTRAERWMFPAVALSAGICEEIVLRAWLLFALYHTAGLRGGWLALTASVLFGAAHAYQGWPGMIVTGLLGMLLCILYVGTGTLLAPMAAHFLIDLRVVFLPPSEASRS